MDIFDRMRAGESIPLLMILNTQKYLRPSPGANSGVIEHLCPI